MKKIVQFKKAKRYCKALLVVFVAGMLTVLSPVEKLLLKCFAEVNNTIMTEEYLKQESRSVTIKSVANIRTKNLADDEIETTGQSREKGIIQTINGFVYFDGQNIPINITFKMTNIQNGAEAYRLMVGNNAPSDIAKDMEYIIITFDITYNDGDVDEVYMTENVCTLQAAKLHFNLSNGDSNAKDVTTYLDNNIYNLTIAKGCTGQGAIAFLHEKDSREPLYFSGFNNIISFPLVDSALHGQDDNKENISSRLIAEVPIIPENQILFDGYSEQNDFDSIATLAVEPVYEQEGVFGGSPVIWSTINDGKFLYFYYTYTYPEKHQPEYACNAIIGEEIKLSCGLHVGMTAVEAESLIPGLYHFKWGNPEYMSVLDWNTGGYPEGWCEQFPQILIAEINYGNELPLTIGLFLDEQEIIRAIAFNNPTGG